MDYKTLKMRHRVARDQQDTSLGIRIHRALSWLDKAEQETDEDAKFIFLWISFNSAYASDFHTDFSERHSFNEFIVKTVFLDEDNQIYDLLFEEFTGLIRVLISNKYIFEPFWKAMRDHDSSDQWKVKFKQSIQVATTALMEKKTEVVLQVVFDRLYVLRNQLIHGGATWQSEANRQQVKDGTQMLEKLIPVILGIMLEEEEFEIGNVMYPVVA